MPESAQRHICSRKRPNKPQRHALAKRAAAVALLAMALTYITGCESETYERDEELVAEQHAQARAGHLASEILVETRDWTLLHPSSERQRQARRLLLDLEAMDSEAMDSEAIKGPGDSAPSAQD
jgi:hypothetical protein